MAKLKTDWRKYTLGEIDELVSTQTFAWKSVEAVTSLRYFLESYIQKMTEKKSPRVTP